jgi:threonine/homoserine/homoserine lactone efflux protein
MLFALLFGTIIGFILALPPGPVSVTAIKLGLFNGKKPGTYLAMGTGLMDFIYCAIAIFATSAAIGTIEKFSTDYPHLMLFIQLFIVLAFVIFGIVTIRVKSKDSDIDELDNLNNSKLVKSFERKGPFLLGIAIALTNIPNPTFLPSLAWITMQVHSLKLFSSDALNNLFFSVGSGLGNFIWLYTIIRLIVRFKTKLSPQMIIRIRQFAGFTFIGFGTVLGYRILTVTHWPEIIRVIFAF